jgi:hypothetical protein
MLQLSVKNGSDPEHFHPDGSTNQTRECDQFVMYHPHRLVFTDSLPKSESPSDTAHTGYSDKHMLIHTEHFTIQSMDSITKGFITAMKSHYVLH